MRKLVVLKAFCEEKIISWAIVATMGDTKLAMEWVVWTNTQETRVLKGLTINRTTWVQEKDKIEY
jgi:hypothetical protein